MLRYWEELWKERKEKEEEREGERNSLCLRPSGFHDGLIDEKRFKIRIDHVILVILVEKCVDPIILFLSTPVALNRVALSVLGC